MSKKNTFVQDLLKNTEQRIEDANMELTQITAKLNELHTLQGILICEREENARKRKPKQVNA